MKSDNEKLERFKQELARDADILAEQRDQANEDMRFVNVTGGQWEGFLENEYQDRAKMEFDIVSNYKNRYVGEWNQNRVGVEFKPDDESTSDDDAELLNGIFRSDFRDNSGKLSVDNAVDEQATCGFGAFGITTAFRDEEDPENDLQEVIWRPIHNAYNSIFFDQSAKREDKLDARWCTELTLYTKDSFKDAFPGKDPVSAYTPSDRSFNSYSSQADRIYVATRYEILKNKEDVFIYNNLSTEEVEVYSKKDHELVEDELKKSKAHKFIRARKITKRTVMMSRFSGQEFLEKERRIAGKYLPIIPIYGYHAYVDGVEHYYGLVRKLKDGGRAWNVQLSQLIENAASAGQDVPIFLREQMEDPAIQNLWADKNNKPYLVVDPVTDDSGNIVASAPIGYNKPSQLDASTATLMQVIPQYIQSVTGGAPQDTLDPNMSGKALNAVLKRENLNTQLMSDNISNSIAVSGTIYQSIAEEVYNTPQMIRTLGKDGTEANDRILKTIVDEKTGLLVQGNTIKGRKFRAYADAGQQYETMREQTVEELSGMLDKLASLPGGETYIPAILATIIANTNGVGMDALKKLNRQQMLLQGLEEPVTEEDKAFMEKSQQPKEDPNAELTKAAATQQMAEAKNLEASSIDKMASAKKKEAETQEIMADIQGKKMDSLIAMRQQTLGRPPQ